MSCVRQVQQKGDQVRAGKRLRLVHKRPRRARDSAFSNAGENGFEVRLVNASHAKNAPGRKTDINDCQWLQELHTFGMLRGSFRPEAHTCVVRSYLRLRDTLSKDCNSLVQRMQKALTEMNIPDPPCHQ
jgi:hypothetical protein